MSNYEGLVERLREETYWLGGSEPYSHDIHPKICDEADDAIEKLVAELAFAVKQMPHRCGNGSE